MNLDPAMELKFYIMKRADRRISIAIQRIYATQLIDSILVGCSLMSPFEFLRLLVVIGIEVAVWANGSRS